MSLLSTDALQRLIADHPEPCISMYFAAVRKDDTAQNAIRFKNLLRSAERSLTDYGYKPHEAAAHLAKPSALLKDELFWDRLAEGVAVFSSNDFFEVYTLPYAVEESVVVNKRFHVKPLFPLVSDQGRFFVLAISRARSRLLEGTRHALRELNLPGLPQGLEASLYPDDRAIQQHTRSFSVERQGAAGAVHGREVDKVDRADLRRYFGLIDTEVNRVLRNTNAPLVVAGVDYELPLYRAANTYPLLEAVGIVGNFDHARASELHPKAWEIVAPRFLNGRERAMERYKELSRTGRTSANLRDIVPAAHDGRVGTLFLADGRAYWGLYEPKTRELLVHDRPESGDEDLLGLAGMATLAAGGQIFVIPPERMPDPAPMAAVYRY